MERGPAGFAVRVEVEAGVALGPVGERLIGLTGCSVVLWI